MSTILRWFEVDGRRHRAWFREADEGQRELVIAGPDWQAPVGEVPVSVLEDFSEHQLTELALSARTVWHDEPEE
jgi:hypothetical protein